MSHFKANVVLFVFLLIAVFALSAGAQQEQPGAQPTQLQPPQATTVTPYVAPAQGETTSPMQCESFSGGGTLFTGVYFGKYENDYGKLGTPKISLGGKYYQYIMPTLRLGLSGGLLFGTDGEEQTIPLVVAGNFYSNVSKGRFLAGLYTGPEAAYVFSFGDVVRIPIGLLLGGGGGAFVSTLAEEKDKEIYTTYQEYGFFVALQPSVGVEATFKKNFSIGLSANYLMADPFGKTDQLGGFGVLLSFTSGANLP